MFLIWNVKFGPQCRFIVAGDATSPINRYQISTYFEIIEVLNLLTQHLFGAVLAKLPGSEIEDGHRSWLSRHSLSLLAYKHSRHQFSNEANAQAHKKWSNGSTKTPAWAITLFPTPHPPMNAMPNSSPTRLMEHTTVCSSTSA